MTPGEKNNKKAAEEVLRKTRALLDGARRDLSETNVSGNNVKRASMRMLRDAVDAVGRMLPAEGTDHLFHCWVAM